MIVPQYWAEARLQHRARDRQLTVRRFGWSDTSQDDAQALAETRVRAAMDEILAGKPLPKREPKVAYNGAHGVPIREEIVTRDGDAIVTRNSYGALCLNTPDVLFVDIDFTDPGVDLRLRARITVAMLVVTTAIAIHVRSIAFGLVAAVVAIGVAQWIAGCVHRYRQRRHGGPEMRAQLRLDAFLLAHPGWRFRKYRTPAGWRLLAMHRTFDPDEAVVKTCFDALGTDAVYALMCARQHCFRARVTPKPWRIGIGTHLRPRPGVWPVDPARLGDRQQWLAEYELASRDHAACRFIDEAGDGPVDASAEAVRVLHDAMSKAESALPIA